MHPRQSHHGTSSKHKKKRTSRTESAAANPSSADRHHNARKANPKRPSGRYSQAVRKKTKPLPIEEQKVIVFNKPYDTLSQFTDGQGRQTLADFIKVKGVYAAGRLDRDSEGLMVLTNDGILQARLTQPSSKAAKTYWVQVDGIPSEDDLDKLRRGVELKDGITLPATIERLDDPSEQIWARTPPVRYRANLPTSWLSITIEEGRNRQVRRMTAHIGFPTLRLIRVSMGPYQLNDLLPGQWRYID